MDKSLIYRSIIVDNSTKPNKFVSEEPKGYFKKLAFSSTCSDEFVVHLQVIERVVADAVFTGKGCAISTAALNIICSSIINKSVEGALKIIDNYRSFVRGEEFDKALLGDLVAFENVSKHLNRVQCALLGANTLKEILRGNHE